MKSDDVLDQQVCGFGRGGELGEGDKVNGLRKTIYYSEDCGEVVGGGETSNEIECYVRPGAVRYGEWLKEALGGLMGNLGLGADRACRHKVLNVPPHPRPPKLSLDEC